MAIFFIGLGDVPGNELLSAAASANMAGSFIRPVVTSRLVTGVSFLEWFFETPGGGGDFGEGAPNNPRAGGHASLSGTLPQAALATNSPLISAASATTGSFLVQGVVSNPTILAAAQVLGGLQIAVSITGDVTSSAFLTGDLKFTLFPELSPDVLADLTGVRPCFPLLIYQDNVSHVGNLFEVDGVTPHLPLYQAFRMSATYSAPPGDQLAAFGARPNSIGMRVMADLDGNGVEEETILFRLPLRNEVVALLDDAQVERWDELSGAWLPFRTLPQRVLAGVRAFEILDPDGIYDYYARLAGLKYSQLAYDSRVILDFIDPNLCPIDLLPLLAQNFGVDIAADQDEATKREILRNWIPLMQIKGLPSAVIVALRQLGFRGFATQVWTRTGLGATEFEERPFNYSNEFPDASDPFTLYPSPAVIIHLNELDGTPLTVIDDITKQTVASFLKLNVLPAHVYIRGFATDVMVGDDDVTATDTVVSVSNVRTGILTIQADTATTAISVSVLPNRANIVAQANIATTSISVTVTAS